MKRSNNRYTRFFFFSFSFLLLLLVVNVVYLSLTGKHLVSGKDISAYGETQGEKKEDLYAKRGRIYSLDGDIIAEDKTVYELKAVIDENRPAYPGQIAYVDDKEYAATKLAPILGVSKEYILSQLSQKERYEVYFGTAGANLTATEKSKIEDLGINGLEFTAHKKRIYYYNHFSSYVIGYARTNSENRNLIVGEKGLERVWNDTLTGINGSVVYLTNSSQTLSLPNSIINEKKAVDGSDIYLTLDSDLQNLLEIKLEDFLKEATAEKVWCGLMEAKTGRILAISSWPDFNLNTLEMDNHINYFFDYPYEVGSVIKPFVYATAIDQGVYQGDALYQSGSVIVDDYTIRDWNKSGWGMISYDDGLIRSSNTAIVSLIKDKMRREEFLATFGDLGFFNAYNMDGFTSESGRNNIETGSVIDVVSMGFGQSSTYTPLQLLRAYSVFANDGKMVNPYIVDRVVEANGNVSYSAKTTFSERIFSSDAIQHVSSLLEAVVNDNDKGTGKQYKMNDLKVMGKTGTGQITNTETGDYASGKMSYTFVGLAPAEDPQVVLVIGCQGPTDVTNSTKMGKVSSYMMNLALSKLNYDGNQISNDVKELQLPSFKNQSVSYAKKQLSKDGFTTIVLGDGNSVINQYPAEGTTVSNTDTIFLLTDALEYTMPDMIGWSRKNATNYLSLMHVNVDYKGNESLVISQSLASGSIIEENTTIILNE